MDNLGTAASQLLGKLGIESLTLEVLDHSANHCATVPPNYQIIVIYSFIKKWTYFIYLHTIMIESLG